MNNIVIIDSLRIKTVEGEFGTYYLAINNDKKQIIFTSSIELKDADRFADEIKKAAEMFRESWQEPEEKEDIQNA